MGDDRADASRIYLDGTYLHGNPCWHADRSPWKARHVLRGLHALDLHPKTVCDIGCGTGLALAEVVRGLGGVDRAVGFEPSPNAPQHESTRDVIELRRTEAAICSERFDLSLMLDVFEHVEDDIRFLRTCAPLAPHHVFHIPLDAHALGIVSHGMIRPRHALGHLHSYTRATAIATLIDAGYEPLHWHFTQSGWDGPGRNPWTPLNMLRRTVHHLSPEMTSRLLGGVALLVVARTSSGRG